MGPIDFAVLGIVLVIVALAAWYVIRAKKRGAKCIGCSAGDCCCSKSGKDKGAKGKDEPCSCGCCSCGSMKSSGESGEETPEA